MQISKQACRTVPFVFVLSQRRFSGKNTVIRRDAFQGLNAGLFIDTNRVNSFALIQIQRVSVDIANRGNAGFVLWIFFVFARQPILVLLRADCSSSEKFINPT